jgi:hypothetical protein
MAGAPPFLEKRDGRIVPQLKMKFKIIFTAPGPQRSDFLS